MIYGISDGFARQHAIRNDAQRLEVLPETAVQRMYSLFRHGFPRAGLSVQNNQLVLEHHEPELRTGLIQHSPI